MVIVCHKVREAHSKIDLEMGQIQKDRKALQAHIHADNFEYISQKAKHHALSLSLKPKES